jgi:Uma2 family endonuclease
VHLKDETDTSDKANEPDYVVPDISIVCDRSKIKDDGIHGAPDLIVEILSKSTAIHDIIRKKDLYEQLGVREYWIVSPFDKSVTVYLLKNGKYVQDKVYYDVADRPDITMDTEKYPPYITTSLYGDDLKIYLKDVFFDLID